MTKLQKQIKEALEERDRIRDALSKIAHMPTPAGTLDEAINAVAFVIENQRDALTDLGGEVRMLREVRVALAEEISRITRERAALVGDIEWLRERVHGMNGQHYLRVLDVVRAAKAWRERKSMETEMDVAEALDAYERGGE